MLSSLSSEFKFIWKHSHGVQNDARRMGRVGKLSRIMLNLRPWLLCLQPWLNRVWKAPGNMVRWLHSQSTQTKDKISCSNRLNSTTGFFVLFLFAVSVRPKQSLTNREQILPAAVVQWLWWCVLCPRTRVRFLAAPAALLM